MCALTLRPDEQHVLQAFVRTTRDSYALKRAQALLWLARGESITSVAQRQLVSRQTISNGIARYQTRVAEPLVARLTDRPRRQPGQGPTWTAARAAIQAVLDQPPIQYGYDVPLWNTPLLQHYLQPQGITTSTRYIRQILRALHYRAKRPRYRLARRSSTWRQAKGGSSAAERTANGQSCWRWMKPS